VLTKKPGRRANLQGEAGTQNTPGKSAYLRAKKRGELKTYIFFLSESDSAVHRGKGRGPNGGNVRGRHRRGGRGKRVTAEDFCWSTRKMLVCPKEKKLVPGRKREDEKEKKDF